MSLKDAAQKYFSEPQAPSPEDVATYFQTLADQLAALGFKKSAKLTGPNIYYITNPGRGNSRYICLDVIGKTGMDNFLGSFGSIDRKPAGQYLALVYERDQQTVRLAVGSRPIRYGETYASVGGRSQTDEVFPLSEAGRELIERSIVEWLVSDMNVENGKVRERVLALASPAPQLA